MCHNDVMARPARPHPYLEVTRQKPDNHLGWPNDQYCPAAWRRYTEWHSTKLVPESANMSYEDRLKKP